MRTPDPEIMRALIFETIDNQMRDADPPETKQTYDRLIAAGYSREETMKLIGTAVSVEIFDVLKHGRPFNQARYVATLHALPTLPWDEEQS